MYKVYYKDALVAADIETWPEVVETVDKLIDSRDLEVITGEDEHWGDIIEYIDWEAMDITYKEY